MPHMTGGGGYPMILTNYVAMHLNYFSPGMLIILIKVQTVCRPSGALRPPVGTPGIEAENTSPVSPACRKRRLNGAPLYIALVADMA